MSNTNYAKNYAKNPTVHWPQRFGLSPRLVWDRGQRTVSYPTIEEARAARDAVAAAGPHHTAAEILSAIHDHNREQT